MSTAMATADVDLLAIPVGVRTPPQSWRRHWDDFQRWEADGGAVQWCVRAEATAVFSLPEDVLLPLRRAMADIAADPILARLGALWHFLVYHIQGEIGDNSNAWPLPAELRGVPVRLFSLAVLVSGTHHAIANAAASGVDITICSASLAFIGPRVCDVRQKRRDWGVESLSFLLHYVRAELFRLGRLTFRASPFPWPFRAFRHRPTGAVRVLCDPCARDRQDGLADGCNDLRDPDAWRSPPLQVGADAIVGVAVNAAGIVERDVVTLPRAEWLGILGPGDWRVGVHVAGGARLDTDACAASFRRAIETFPRRHPGQRLAGFTRVSWLLDPAMKELLGPASNIARFAGPFRLLAVPGDHRQAYDLIYGDPNADPRRCAAGTSLQLALARHVAHGGAVRAVAGFLPWDEAVDRCRCGESSCE